MRILIAVFALAALRLAMGQPVNPPPAILKGNPPGGIGGSCSGTPLLGYLDSSGRVITCKSGVWTVTGTATGTVTHTGNLNSGVLIIGNGSADVTVPANPVTLSGVANGGITASFRGAGGSANFNLAEVPIANSYIVTNLSTVTAGHLVTLSSTGTVGPATAGSGALGIAESTVTGNGTLRVLVDEIGPTTCTAEGSITAGHWLIQGSTAPSACKDSSQTALTSIPVSTAVVGFAIANSTDGATNPIQVLYPYQYGSQNTATSTIGAGTAAMGTSLLTANNCASAVTVGATGVLSTDTIQWTPNGDVSGTTGYGKAATDGLIIYPYPTADNVNFVVCNGTGSSITPGAITLNWRVVR